MNGNDAEKRARHRRERILAAAIVLLLGVIAAVIVYYNRHQQNEIVDQTYIPKETPLTPEAVLLRDYVRVDTSNPPGKERAGAEWLAGIMRAQGVQPELIDSAPGRTNLYARIKGKRSGEGLLLLNHIDVVPADPKAWQRPPFAADIYLNEIYARGVLDMKGTAICELRAFLDVAKAGRQPERDIVFLAVADEEEGAGALGLGWLIEHRPDVIDGIRYAVNEGGITEMLKEKVTYFGIEIGTKLTVTLLLEAPTREQLQKARIALEPWFISHEADRISPEVRRFLQDLAPQRTDFKSQLADIDKAIANGEFWQLPVGYREVTQNGVWADAVVRSGTNWQMRTRLLNLPDEDPDKRLAWLAKQVAPFGVRIGTILRKEPATRLSSTETPFFQLLAREANKAYSCRVGTEILNRFFNDSRYLRRRGIEVYGISPFPVDFFQSESIHGVDERIRIDFFEQGVEYMRRVVTAWAFD